MATTINTTFKLKRGTAARWAEVNLILELGEPGFVYDTNRLKIGDGVTAWNDLPYIDGKREIGDYDYLGPDDIIVYIRKSIYEKLVSGEYLVKKNQIKLVIEDRNGHIVEPLYKDGQFLY